MILPIFGVYMRKVLFFSALIVFSSQLFAQQPARQSAPGTITLNLWPQGAPGAPSNAGPETNSAAAKDNIAGRPIIRLGNVTSPTMTLYAAKANPSGQAVVVFPGGGYQILAIDLEGTEICDWLNRIQVTCVLLKYRVPNTGPYPKSAAALQDAQRAVGMVRAHAAEWHIHSDRIGVLGFSAGGYLAAALGTHFDRRLYDLVDSADKLSCRPDFALIIYPGYLALAERALAFNPDIHVTAQTPPSFLIQAEDDPVHVENSLLYYRALKDAGVPAEMHLYAKGGHGYGIRPTALPITHWEDLATAWLQGLE